MPEPDDTGAGRAPGAVGHATALGDLLREYKSPGGHYDELRDDTGELRPHWATFVAQSPLTDFDDVSREQRRVTQQLQANGVTYYMHGAGGPPRGWSLDVLPHIVPASEWAPLAFGLQQRARLLELIAQDLYGPQRLLSDGHVPATVVMRHPGFLRPVHGIAPPSGRFLHVVAFDVARSFDGGWRVVDARTQAPSGAGYALENRLSISQLYPKAFRDAHVSLLAPYFRTLRETLLEAAPCESGTPHVVLLTPGPYNETYVEHAYLARYLGFTLAEGADLTVRDDHVFLKTVAGLRPVHAILRRLDDDYCDPVELRAESTIGVPGLLQAWRAGHILLANALGTGILESPVLQSYLPAISEVLLGEPLQLSSVAAAWGGNPPPGMLAEIPFDRTVIKPAFSDARVQAVVGPSLDQAERRSWTGRIQADPERFVLEEYVPLSHTAAWTADEFASRALMIRVFLVADARGDYRVMDGGLARIAGSERELVSGQRGGSSKDTWVLSDRPVERVSLLRGRLRPDDIVRSERMVSSRAAEHLFWMGRYAERSENGARLMRAVLTRLPYGDPVVSAASRPIVRTCAHQGMLGSGATNGGDAEWPSQEFEQTIIRGLYDPKDFQSVAFNIEQTVRAAGAVRDRLSTDNWRELNRVADRLSRIRRSASLPASLDMLDRVIMSLVAVGGLEMAHMTRDDGWRFMSLGRHLERLAYVATTVGEVATSESQDDPALLEWLLDLSDSIITYRARYMGRAEWLAVADLLLFDARNPRSAVFQLAKMSKHVALLPDADLGGIVPQLERLAERRTGIPSSADLFDSVDATTEFIESSEQIARRLSDALTLRYFTHVYQPLHTLL
jgi:uncharacterized circularly permuted ATP-grasp superfamily protein/uncharacterized alpha-E superfamily protein